MYLLHVDLNVKPGSESSLEETFKTVFRPAISKQEGFERTLLMRSATTGTDYRLVIGFASQPLQQKWVAQPLHQEVWPQMESHFNSYNVMTYNVVDA